MSSNFACPRIKNGLAIRYDGQYSLCCMMDEKAFRKIDGSDGSGYHLKHDSLPTFIDSQWRQSMIQHQERGEWPEECKGCLDSETSEGSSYRTGILNNQRRHLHVHVGNVCDSDCIMCGPQWSTKVMSRLSKHPDDNQVFPGKARLPPRSIWNDKEGLDNLKECVRWTDHLHFGGGEPMLDKRIWDFLSTVVRNDLSISFVSNLNTLPSDQGFEILSSFKQVNVNVSIDATGSLYEWIRQDLSWTTLIRNLTVMRSRGIHLSVNCEIQAHNLLNLADHYKLFNRLGLNPDYFMVVMPRLLQARNAPMKVIDTTIDLLQRQGCDDIIKKLLNARRNHNPNDTNILIKHTEYLNSHRHHRFDVEKWNVADA